MTFNNNLQTTEPAFLSHEKYARQRPRDYHKNLTYFCYSLSNLALIVACIVALGFSVKFLQDDPLYEYGEYLLTLKFYRYIVFIIVILPLTLLVALFNAASACFLSGSRKRELGSSALGVKMFYQISMAILIIIGLIFIAPSIRQSSVASQMEIEIRRHMKWRYDSEFSYEFIDRIQDEYECCDQLWYRSNYADKLPLSCFHPDGTYSFIHERNCPEVLSSMVSTRCIVIASCLIIILLSLALLIGLDINELMSSGSSRHYDLRERETKVTEQQQQQQDETTGSALRRNSPDELDRSEEHDLLVEELSNRLKMREREREIPLLPKTAANTTTYANVITNQNSSGLKQRRSSLLSDGEEEEEDPTNDCSPTNGETPKTRGELILARANYHHYNNRPRSPMFVRTPDSVGSSLDEHGQNTRSNFLVGPTNKDGRVSPKSVLKKTSSFQKIDSDLDDDDDDDDNDDDQSNLRESSQRSTVQRDAQTRRSLLNVRFAE